MGIEYGWYDPISGEQMGKEGAEVRNGAEMTHERRDQSRRQDRRKCRKPQENRRWMNGEANG